MHALKSPKKREKNNRKSFKSHQQLILYNNNNAHGSPAILNATITRARSNNNHNHNHSSGIRTRAHTRWAVWCPAGTGGFSHWAKTMSKNSEKSNVHQTERWSAECVWARCRFFLSSMFLSHSFFFFFYFIDYTRGARVCCTIHHPPSFEYKTYIIILNVYIQNIIHSALVPSVATSGTVIFFLNTI